MNWVDFKDLASHLGVAKDALHIYLAFSIQVAAAALLRRPMSSWIPWACVLAAELLNEFLDIHYGEELQMQEWQVLGAKHDVLNTMALPTLLLLLCRYAPGLFVRRLKAAPTGAAETAEGGQEESEAR
jgi:hypothetical protein